MKKELRKEIKRILLSAGYEDRLTAYQIFNKLTPRIQRWLKNSYRDFGEKSGKYSVASAISREAQKIAKWNWLNMEGMFVVCGNKIINPGGKVLAAYYLRDCNYGQKEKK